MNRRRPLLPVACLVAALLVLSACFGSSSSGPPPPIAVAFVTALPASVTVGGSFQIAAALANDSSTKGINWTCTPSTSGTFAPTNTQSGVATTFTFTTAAAGQMSVTITATSVADPTKFASGNVTVIASSVTFSAPAPPPTLTVSGGAPVTATITSSIAAAVSDGVDWTATCSVAGGCGSFSSSHTNSGVSTTYTAPNSTPAGALAVTIKAASTFDSSDSVSAVISVGGPAPTAFLCAGCTYTFTAAGQDIVETTTGGEEASPYGIAGQFTTDGQGNVTGGEQDYSDFAGTTLSTPDTIMSGVYSFTPDGRGTITLNSVDRGVETLGVVLVSANHMLVTEFDTLATASGSMDLQTASQAALNGGYAYVAGGEDLVNEFPLGFGGVFNVTNAGVISSSSGVCDANDGGNTSTQQGYTSGSGYTGPDAFGRIQITLRANFIGNLNSKYNLGVTGPVILAAYINDATHLKFVEVDGTFGITAGLAVGQTGSLTSLPANSSYVFTTFGSSAEGPYDFVANVTSNGNSNLQNPNGASSPNSDVNNAGVPSTGSITGTYSVGDSGRVAVALQGVPLASITGDKSGKTAVNFAMYLTGGSDPAMTLELDDFGITTGSAYTQTASTFSLTSISGFYGLNYTLFGYDLEDEMYDIEFDATGQLFADGQGNLLGLQDINKGLGTGPVPSQASSGSYATNATSRFTGTLGSTPTGTLAFSYYVVSPTQVVIIETDTASVTLGVFQLQTPPF